MKKHGLTVMVIGSGGREHALAWKLAQSPRVQHVLVAPGNPGTARTEKCRNLPASTIEQWLDAARLEHVDLTVVGPEAPLAAGIVDAFREAGLTIFGPTQAAAQLEASKDFAKRFMQRHGIPTAAYQTFADAAQAHAWVETKGAPIVVKADGLAAGKGVVVAQTLAEAHEAIDRMLVANAMGDAGARVVIEEFMEGEEASFIVLADGRNALAFATSQDHKRLLDGDRGPNTGGMGAYSPAPVVTPDVHARVMREIIQPTLAGSLLEVEAQWDRRPAVGVVLAAAGYPEAPRKGDVITGLPEECAPLEPQEPVLVFHAGTAEREGQIVTHGGRVLCVTALGETLREAIARAYAVADRIEFAGKQMRRDIGHRALNRHHP